MSERFYRGPIGERPPKIKMPKKLPAPHSEDRIEEAMEEIAGVIEFGHSSDFKPILQRLYDDGKKAGAEEARQRSERDLARLAQLCCEDGDD